MDSSPTTAARPPCFGTRLCAELKRLVMLAIFFGLLALAGKYYCFDRLNEEIRSRFESQLREHYQGLTVSVRSARRVAGQGLEIRGVRIAEGGGTSAPTLVQIDEIFARCDTRLPEFLQKPPQVTLVEVRGLKLRAERKPSGRWNLGHLLPLPPCQSGCAPLATIADASLELIDPTSQHASGLMLRDIQLAVTPESQPNSDASQLRIHGTLTGDHVERVEIDGLLDPLTSRWELRGSVEGLEFSPRMTAALPRELATAVASLSSIRGRTYFGFHASRAAHEFTDAALPPVQFVVNGKISEGRIDDARFPEPLTEVEATLRLDNRGLSIGNLSARCGASQVELTAPLIGLSPGDPLDVELAIRDLSLETLSPALLPPAAQDLWRRFSPRGRVDITGRLQCDKQQWRPDLKIQCRDVSLAYDRFRYRLTDGTGTIVLAPNRLTTQLRLAGGGQFIRCEADITNPGPQFTGAVKILSEGPIVIDEKLLAALDPPTQKIVRGFRPRGAAGLAVLLDRNDARQPPRVRMEINLQDCAIQHERFPYPIDRITGLLLLADGKWQFRDLLGRTDSAEIRATGVWNPVGPAGPAGPSSPLSPWERAGVRVDRSAIGPTPSSPHSSSGQLSIQFLARDVPLAAELRQALPPSAQSLWANLQPRGNIDDLQVDLGYSGPGGQWSLDVTAQKFPAQSPNEGRSISLEPAWFRYALSSVTGSLHYKNGRLDLARIRATHGPATISTDGRCTMLPTGGCRLELYNLAADRVVADQELLAALPADLGQSLGRVPLEGPLNLLGKLNISVPPQQNIPPQIDWDFHLDVENGRLATSTPVEHIHGGLALSGRQSIEGVFARGELQIDSAMVRGLQLTNVQGPFWCDGRQLVFGTLADRNPAQGAPRQVTARTLGGLLSLDGLVSLADAGTFDLQATLANGDLPEIARQLAPHQQPPTGKVYGVAHIAGSPQAVHTWHGDGKINLREADLYELPSMITLLKLLSVQRPNSTAFTNSNIDFRIEGDELELDRIDFSGDAISLKGKGRVNNQRQLDLKFYPLVGREERQLAIFRPLLGQTGQEFMLIEVTGPLDQPEIHRHAFPRLDAQLAQLFPELARDQPVETKTPSVLSPRGMLNRLRPTTGK
ncbi:MAG TPA: AsmA-like C-terminal region-containing protein [Pirellulaceae bacterium]